MTTAAPESEPRSGVLLRRARRVATALEEGPTCAVRPAAGAAGRPQWRLLAGFALLAVVLLAFVGARYGASRCALLALGLGLGAALLHSQFGFTSGYRQLVAVGNGAALRAHAVLLGTTATLAAILIGTGTGLFGTTPRPSGGPLGVGLVVGAFLFGLGMQLGGACASGTLFAVGAGQSAILLTLGGFVAGSVLYAWAFPVLGHLPALPAVVLAEHIGWVGSWLVTIAALAVVVVASLRYQARRNPPPTSPPPTAHGLTRVWRGAWPMPIGAVVLGVLAAGVLLVSGSTWGITSAFTLWGSRLLQLVGLHPQAWEFWRQPGEAATLSAPLLADRTTLTDVGIMVGAALAAAAGGTWTWRHRLPGRTAAASLIGGVLLGVGARLANGCNIGALLGGICTGSLSGWVWGVAALAGTWVGLRVRPWLGLAVPESTDSVC